MRVCKPAQHPTEELVEFSLQHAETCVVWSHHEQRNEGQ